MLSGARIFEPQNMSSPTQLAELRAYVAREFGGHDFTCDDCGARFSCPYAFDPYNTAGDCLAEK